MLLLKKDVAEDIKRMYGENMKEGTGVILLDIGYLFPYANQEDLCTDFYLTDRYEQPEINHNGITLGSICLRCADKELVRNHRYPNRGYVTLSSKVGRKVSREGCYLTAPADVMNRMKFLSVSYGFGEEMLQMIIPVSIRLSSDKPYVCMSVRINLREPLRPELRIISNEFTKESSIVMHTYDTDCEKAGECTPLYADPEKSEKYEKVVFETEIQTYSF